MNVVQTGIVERRSNQRLGKYVLTLELDGQFYSTTDWSLGGFCIDGYKGDLEEGGIADVAIVLETGSQTFEETVRTSIVRIEEDEQRLAARFTELESEAFDLLDGWQTGRLQRLAARKSA